MLLILCGIGLGLCILGSLGAILFGILILISTQDDLSNSCHFLTYKVLPYAVFAFMIIGIPMIGYATNSENQYNHCLETINSQEYCEETYLSNDSRVIKDLKKMNKITNCH